MKTLALALLCSLLCVACAKQLTTLSDGRPGYAVTCDTMRERCLDAITLACRGKSYTIVTERANEIVHSELLWVHNGVIRPNWVDPSHNSRYWIEARCDQF